MTHKDSSEGFQRRSRQRARKNSADDDEIDADWREQARFLYRAVYYAKPGSDRFEWYARMPATKGDANVFRLFVERAYRVLRPAGRLAQVLPDSAYVSAPATGVRQRLLRKAYSSGATYSRTAGGFSRLTLASRLFCSLRTRRWPDRGVPRRLLRWKDAAGHDRAKTVEELPATSPTSTSSTATLVADADPSRRKRGHFQS